jgi:hypothetical protein
MRHGDSFGMSKKEKAVFDLLTKCIPHSTLFFVNCTATYANSTHQWKSRYSEIVAAASTTRVSIHGGSRDFAQHPLKCGTGRTGLPVHILSWLKG